MATNAEQGKRIVARFPSSGTELLRPRGLKHRSSGDALSMVDFSLVRTPEIGCLTYGSL